LFDLRPDLSTFGKVIGGGMPLAAYAGPRELMKQIAPAGPVYQAGTLSGNPLAVAAGLAALDTLARDKERHYGHLEAMGARLQAGFERVANERGVPFTATRQGSMLGFFFAAGPIQNQDHVDASDRALYARVFHGLLDRGVHPPPSAYEAWFLSTAHNAEDIDATIAAFDGALGDAIS
jgi:glutamate-1-semialdehyde 2,1-aminomutase